MAQEIPGTEEATGPRVSVVLVVSPPDTLLPELMVVQVSVGESVLLSPSPWSVESSVMVGNEEPVSVVV